MSQVLAQSLSPLQGGSDSRISDTPSKLQILQQFSVAGNEDGKQIWSSKDRAIYVGMVTPTDRLAKTVNGQRIEEETKEKSKQKEESTAKGSQ